MIGRLLVPKM